MYAVSLVNTKGDFKEIEFVGTLTFKIIPYVFP